MHDSLVHQYILGDILFLPCLLVCWFVGCWCANFNIGHNFCNIEDSNLIFGMHVYLMELHILSGERSRSRSSSRSKVKFMGQNRSKVDIVFHNCSIVNLGTELQIICVSAYLRIEKFKKNALKIGSVRNITQWQILVRIFKSIKVRNAV